MGLRRRGEGGDCLVRGPQPWVVGGMADGRRVRASLLAGFSTTPDACQAPDISYFILLRRSMTTGPLTQGMEMRTTTASPLQYGRQDIVGRGDPWRKPPPKVTTTLGGYGG